MFYFKITERRRYRSRSGVERRATMRTYYREYGARREVGEFVAHLLDAGAQRVGVEPMKQAAFQRAVAR